MAGDFVELGATITDHLTEKHFDTVYDKVTGNKATTQQQQQQQQQQNSPQYGSQIGGENSKRRHRNQLPSPERDPNQPRSSHRRQESIVRDLSPERSETSERVLRAYEAERDDPRRKPESVFAPAAGWRSNDRNMSAYTSGNAGYAQRPRSQPPRSRYDDDRDSDYDEHEGRRYAKGGRGYRDDDDYDREVIETERYKGPARPYDLRRDDSYTTRNDPYGAGAVTQYRRSNNDLTTDVSRRTRGRDDRYDDRERSYSRSPPRSPSRDRGDGFKGKLDEYFDTTAQGLGVGIAGAVIGGLAGRQFGKEHRQRDIILGAIVGGLGANAAEHKYRDWKEDKEEKKERYEQRYDGRARSSVR